MTDGTVGGSTVELVPGAGGPSDPAGLNPYDMTVFGAELLFGATDAGGNVGLWETDGTAVGTQLITNTPSTPGSLTVLGGKVLFSGRRSRQPTRHLWVTDGTSGNTHELTNISGAGADFNPRFLFAFGNEVLFNGTDASNLQGLWETDGTALGTPEIFRGCGHLRRIGSVQLRTLQRRGTIQRQRWQRPSAVVGDRRSGRRNNAVGERRPRRLANRFGSLDLTAVTLNPPVTNNLLWQNTSTGQVSVWELSGNTRVGGGPAANSDRVGRRSGPATSMATERSPTSCGKTPTGKFRSGRWTGNTRTGGGSVANLGPSWQVAGTGDFDGDGKSDILWQNTSTGQVSMWEMDGNTHTGGGPVANLGPSWRLPEPATSTAMGKSDILWQNTSTGQVSMWEMDGNTHTRGGPVSNLGPSWKAVGTGEFNHDGKSDILFQNASTGQVSVWEMDGATRTGGRAGQQSRDELAGYRTQRRRFRHYFPQHEHWPSLDLGHGRRPGREADLFFPLLRRPGMWWP